jgi:hypothetical protein
MLVTDRMIVDCACNLCRTIFADGTVKLLSMRQQKYPRQTLSRTSERREYNSKKILHQPV